MKKLIYVVLFSTLLFSCGDKTKQKKATTTQKTETKETVDEKYSGTKFVGVKSGIIEYKITGKGNVMGSKMEVEGTARYAFKNWGAMEREERNIAESYNGTKSTPTKELSISKDGMEYEINTTMHQITKTKDSRLAMLKKMNSSNFEEATQKFMTELGGKKVAAETVKGYKCEVWQFMGSKTWIYKGIPLKTENKMMGMVRTEEAVKVRLNTSVSNSEFELPKDFRVVIGTDDNEIPDAQEIKKSMKELQEMKTMSYEEWKKKMASEGELKGVSEKQLRQTYDAMQQMLNAQ